jgi:hypothetical protein
MTLKGSGVPQEYELIDEYDGGVGWIAYPEERMRRASHAMAVDGEVYLIDPLQIPDLEGVVASYGDIAGVVVLLGRHSRDSESIAREFDVPIHVPAWVDYSPPEDITLERHEQRLAGSDFELIETVNWPGWREASLFDGETLVVPESVGTASFFRSGAEPLGVQAVLRMTPPGALRGLTPKRILVGHGSGIHEDATATLERALDSSRRNAPGAWLNALTGD